MHQGLLENVKVYGLLGYKNFDVDFQDNTLVIVGENGSGKTTFLRVLFSLLSGSWPDLLQFRFDSIQITVDSTVLEIDRRDVEEFTKRPRKSYSPLRKYVTAKTVNQIHSQLLHASLDEFPLVIERMAVGYGIPRGMLLKEFDQLQLRKEADVADLDARTESIKRIRRMHSTIQSALNCQILYLPTYRRIERELQAILQNIDSAKLSHAKGPLSYSANLDCIELVEFGMKDVQAAIDRTLVQIKEFARESLDSLTLNYLGDVVNREYVNTGPSEMARASEDAVRGVLDRIPGTILTGEHKSHLATILKNSSTEQEVSEQQQILLHYFSKLLKFQEDLRNRESAISDFCELCSDYILDKRFVYDSPSFKFAIHPSKKTGLESVNLSELSSGEKQIVSLFSHLYLSGNRNYFVLIDEPELSLSVPWQRRFLVDIKRGAFCSGLVAVTHSPFIYDNSLRPYAHALGEFTE